MSAKKDYPDFWISGFIYGIRSLLSKEAKVIPTFYKESTVFISLFSKGRDNQKVGIIVASKARELKELKWMADELEAEIKALENEMKAEMEARDTEGYLQDSVDNGDQHPAGFYSPEKGHAGSVHPIYQASDNPAFLHGVRM